MLLIYFILGCIVFHLYALSYMVHQKIRLFIAIY